MSGTGPTGASNGVSTGKPLENDDRGNRRSSSSRQRSRSASNSRSSSDGESSRGRGGRRRREDSRTRQHQQPQRRRSRSRDRNNQRRSRRRSRSASPPRLSEEEARMRDAKCVFVSQLQVKASEEDVAFHFGLVCNVVEVALITEKSTGRSKGFGYIELSTMDDVNKALTLSGLPFIWRDGTKGFPITVRPTEAHKLYLEKANQTAASSLWGGSVASHQQRHQQYLQQQQTNAANAGDRGPQQNIELVEVIGPGSAKAKVDGGPVQVLPTHRGRPMNTRLLYVGNLDKSLTESDVKEIVASFGPIDYVQLKMDPNTGVSKGYAFARFREVSSTAVANEKLNGFELMGQKLTCNPVNDKHMSSSDHRSNEEPLDDEGRGAGGISLGASRRVQLMSKLAGGAAQEFMSTVPILPPNPSAGPPPTRQIAISNMFDPSQETAVDWELDIERDTRDECSRFGRVLSCLVDKSNPTVGRVLVLFQNVQDAVNCANSMRGRWFDKRQVQVDFVPVS